MNVAKGKIRGACLRDFSWCVGMTVQGVQAGPAHLAHWLVRGLCWQLGKSAVA